MKLKTVVTGLAFLIIAAPIASAASTYLVTDLGTLPGCLSSVANAINSNGQVVGYAHSSSGADYAFLYSGGLMADLNSLIPTNPGWTVKDAAAINDSGQIVGDGTSPSGQTHAFHYNGGIITDLGTLGGSYSTANGINNNGQVVGISTTSSLSDLGLQLCVTH